MNYVVYVWLTVDIVSKKQMPPEICIYIRDQYCADISRGYVDDKFSCDKQITVASPTLDAINY